MQGCNLSASVMDMTLALCYIYLVGALIFAETVFYIVISLAIIILGVLLGIMTYELVKITRNLRRISENLSSMSKDTEEKVREIIGRLSDSPILSFFMKKDLHNTAGQKGRNKK